MKYTEDECYKCKKMTWDLTIADGKFDSKKGKLYCQDCYYNKARTKDLRESPSIDVMELLRKANKKG